MQLIFIVLSLLIIQSECLGCMWLEGTLLSGIHLRTEGKHINFDNIDSIYAQKKIQYTNALQSDNKINRAVGLTVAENYSEAITLLQRLHDTSSSYTIQANLGTIYELAGDYQNAKKYINMSVKTNPESHYGSEWIHQSILNHKINQPNEEFILSKQRFHNDGEPDFSDLNFENVHKKIDHLYYQLEERMFFVKPKDKYVASLLFDLAHYVAYATIVEDAIKILELSKTYGYHKEELINDRLDYFHSILTNSTKIVISTDEYYITTRHIKYGIIAFAITVLTLIILIKFRRRTKKRAAI